MAEVDFDLEEQIEELCDREIGFIPNEQFENENAQQHLEEILTKRYMSNKKTRLKPSKDLPAYFASLYETPLLTPEEEHDLFWGMNYLKYRANLLRLSLDEDQPDELLIREIMICLEKSAGLRDRIVQANLRLVVSLARKFCDQYSAFEELVSDGNLTLINAVEKFDCSRGFRFSTYATHATQRDFFRQLDRRRKNAQRITGEQNDYLEQFCTAEQKDDEPAIAQSALFKQVMAAFDQELDARERHIVCARFGINEQESGQTLRSVGEQLGISKERVRQLQISAIEKLRAVISSVGELDSFAAFA